MIAYKTKFKRKDDTIYYNEKTWQSERVLWSVLVNAYDTLADVYIFENFDKYCEQLKSDKQEDKKQEYWKVGRKKLIDSVSISIAFENINKAILQRNGFLIHKINPKFDKVLAKKQREGNPIKIEDFFKNNYTVLSSFPKEAKLNGLYDRLDTINYSHTLNDKYQQIINFKKEFVWELKKLNKKRNSSHFFTGNNGAFEISNYIKRWSFIMHESFEIINKEIKKVELNMKNYD